jgi:hypothetical protein
VATPTTIQVLAHTLAHRRADLVARVAAFVAAEAARLEMEVPVRLEFEAKNAFVACGVCIVSSGFLMAPVRGEGWCDGPQSLAMDTLCSAPPTHLRSASSLLVQVVLHALTRCGWWAGS